jgi:Na+-translocating ferredoxin:NAD+ oxidoreductase RNF subunit RnfB
MSAYFLKWMPAVDEDLCIGRAASVEACGPKSLELQDRVAVLARPDTCGSEEHCISPCPAAAIQMRWMATTGDKTHGKWRAEVNLAITSSAGGRDA